MGPRADYICEKCEAAGKMDAPVELPVLATKCPICGRAKWFRRVWSGASSNPGVVQADRHAKSKFTTPLLAKDWDARQAVKDAGVQGRTRQTPALAQPIGSVLGMLGASTGQAKPVMGGIAHPALAAAPPLRPGPGSMRPKPGQVGH
jgi:hypothetical protein